jgi:hypothetical protein
LVVIFVVSLFMFVKWYTGYGWLPLHT